ncbi:tripartite tricarboxylate transporter substrate-binding protein [Cupriavidus sp. CuC1]|uniref:tripartite tricarboxylate transporter substrate-binding protein n=1 Tax=Cupriavidus sp. CuC1 TaxID=3373131 RepID=UPI0037D8FECB
MKFFPRIPRISRSVAACFAGVLAYMGVSVPAAAADAYPAKPITIVVPYSAGGASDIQVRVISQQLSTILRQPIIVDNRAGASGAIGAAFVARAVPDGYTLLYPNNGLLIAALLNKSAGYDPLKDLAPISTVTTMPMVLVVNKSMPANNLREFFAYAKGHPNTLNYATAGPASYGNLATHLLSQAAGLSMTQVPYRGEANTTMSVRSGEAQVLFTSPSATMMGQVNAGSLKLLGVASAGRSEVAPNAQPINEVLPGFKSEIWFGLMAPAKTPQPVIDKLNQAVQQVLKDPGIRAKLLANAAVAQPSTPQAFDKLLRAEHAQFAEIIRKHNITAD